MHVEMYIAGICMKILNLNTKLCNLRKKIKNVQGTVQANNVLCN